LCRISHKWWETMYSNIWRGSDTCTVHHKWDTTLRAVVTKYGLIYIFWRRVVCEPLTLFTHKSSKGNKMLSCKNPWFMVANHDPKFQAHICRKNMLQKVKNNTSPFTGGPSLIGKKCMSQPFFRGLSSTKRRHKQLILVRKPLLILCLRRIPVFVGPSYNNWRVLME